MPLILFALPAFAAPPCDFDDDGFVGSYAGCTPGVSQMGLYDCDDSDSYVNPAMPEIANDGVDDNCNGWDKAVRAVSERFENLDAWYALTGQGQVRSHVAITTKGVELDPLLQGNTNVPAGIDLATDITWKAGWPLVTLEVSSWTPPVLCNVQLVGPSTQMITLSGVGYYALPFPEVGEAPFDLEHLRINCSGSGKASVRWVVASDGSDGLHMLGGASDTLMWHTTMMPGGGATNLTLVPTADGVYAASDVGGVAFTDATGPQWFWEPRNGVTGAGLEREQDLAVWGLAADPGDPLRVFALTGGQDGSGNLYGGFWSSDDGGATWDLVADESDGVSAYGRGHACAADGAARAGGKLVQ